MRRASVRSLLLALPPALAMLLIAGCAGPRPRVEEVVLHPPATPGEPYRVEAVVRNTGRGNGEVRVLFHLTSVTGERFAEEKDVDLGAGETARVVAEISAPPGAYIPEAQAQYPPD
jgi:hypothetical protein